MSETFVAEFAQRHGLERLLAADPAGFAAALDDTAQAGTAMIRPGDKESGPAPVFRPPARA